MSFSLLILRIAYMFRIDVYFISYILPVIQFSWSSFVEYSQTFDVISHFINLIETVQRLSSIIYVKHLQTLTYDGSFHFIREEHSLVSHAAHTADWKANYIENQVCFHEKLFYTLFFIVTDPYICLSCYSMYSWLCDVTECEPVTQSCCLK